MDYKSGCLNSLYPILRSIREDLANGVLCAMASVDHLIENEDALPFEPIVWQVWQCFGGQNLFPIPVAVEILRKVQ